MHKNVSLDDLVSTHLAEEIVAFYYPNPKLDVPTQDMRHWKGRTIAVIERIRSECASISWHAKTNYEAVETISPGWIERNT